MTEEHAEGLPSSPTGEQLDQIISRRVDLEALENNLSLKLRYENTSRDLSRLVLRLSDFLKNYDTILSDDASGRLISLVIGGLAEVKTGRKPKTFFLASGRIPDDKTRASTDQKLLAFLEGKGKSIGRALVVTEHVDTGESMEGLMDVLDEAGIQYDIAAVSAFSQEGGYSSRLNNRLICGSYESYAGADFYNRPKATGVRKVGGWGEERLESSAHPIKHEEFDPALVKQARQDVKIIVKALAPLVKN